MNELIRTILKEYVEKNNVHIKKGIITIPFFNFIL